MQTDVIKVENTHSWLLTDEVGVRKKLHLALRAREKGYIHSSAYKKGVWDGYKEFFKPNSGLFMTGLLPHVISALKVMNRPYKILDMRTRLEWAHTNVTPQFLHQWTPPGEQSFDLYDYQADFINQALKYYRGLITSPTGCHRKGQLVLMYDGTTKAVEDVVVGDQLMGPDSTPRKVLHLCRGRDQMYKVVPIKGKPFVVNGDHVLTLVKTTSHNNRHPGDRGGMVIDVKLRDYLGWSVWKKHLHKLLRTGVAFPEGDTLPVAPYFLGVTLGDGGCTQTPRVTTQDQEIIVECHRQAFNYGMECKTTLQLDRCPTYRITHGIKREANPLANDLRGLGLWGVACGDKFIPHAYKTASQKARLSLLAGLIDTDGELSGGGYICTWKSEQLAQDTAFVARSVGLAAYVKPCKKKSQNGTEGTYHRVSISGDCTAIPTRIPLKEAPSRKQKKDVLRTGFDVEYLGIEEDYYGFNLNKDHRYLLDDFTVSHNSGKTNILIGIIKCLPPKTPVLFMTKNAGLVDQNYKEMQKWGVQDLGRYYGGHKEPNYVMCVTSHKDSLAGIENLLPKFKVLIVDEVHECVSDVPVAAYKKMSNAVCRYGISATPFKFAGKDKVQKYTVMGHFGAIFKTTTTESGYLTTKELQKRGILSKSRCTFYPIDKPNTIAHEPYMDAVTLGIANNFDFLKTVTKLARSLTGRTLILVERIDEGDYLKQLLPEAHWLKGADKLEDRAEVFRELKHGENVICICMRQIITAGINVFVHSLLNAAGGQAEHSVIQQMGRGLRCAPDKDRLDFYDFIFRTNEYLYKHSCNRIKVLGDEGHDIIMKDSIDF